MTSFADYLLLIAGTIMIIFTMVVLVSVAVSGFRAKPSFEREEPDAEPQKPIGRSPGSVR
jgi:hypothetical protein